MNPFKYITNFIGEWRENSRTKIVDSSHLKKIPERNPLHLAFMCLFTISMVAVLWQHCHPFITILILALILPLSLQAYVPYAKFGFGGRFIVQLLIVVVALIWTFYRIKTGVPVDKTAVEMIGIATTTFLMGRRKRDYGYLFLICMFLLIYAALLPRILFLMLFIVAVILILLILYFNRPINLASDPELKMAPLKFFRAAPFVVMHIGLAALFFFLVFSLIPRMPTKTKGALEVSFLTEKDSFVPVDMQTWLRGDNIKTDPGAKQFIRATGKPDSLGNSGTPINVPNSKNKTNADGNGSGSSSSQGKDLVFTAKTPFKLYHLVQLYDVYDGFTWKLSPQLSNASLRNVSRKEIAPAYSDTDIYYTIVKWISPKLPAPYLPILFNISDNQEHVRLTQKNFFSAELYAQSYPNPPFKYKTTTRLVLPKEENKKQDEEKPFAYWQERLSRHHYIQLPPKKISKRLRTQVENLVKDKTTPYEKAMALRDYLRSSFPYKLHAQKPPQDKEMADYFVFELKEGHCEYFATALAVMARVAKLPARIATGFSPGNYNTLTNMFEVYEYHAHAWTQIFIEDKGWLTFDATPPSAIPSQTTPLGIGVLRDPFGDEWKITPPEITKASIKLIKNSILENEKEKTEDVSKIEAMLASALNKDKDAEKEKKNVKKAEQKKKVPEKKNWIAHTNDFLKQFNIMLGKIVSTIKEQCTENWRVTIPCAILLMTFLLSLRITQLHLRQWRLMRKANLFLEKARNPNEDNAERIRALYFAIRARLKLANFSRHKNQELIAYADSLKKVSVELSDNTHALFVMFYRIEYGNHTPDTFETDNMINRGEKILSLLLNRKGNS